MNERKWKITKGMFLALGCFVGLKVAREVYLTSFLAYLKRFHYDTFYEIVREDFQNMKEP